MTSRKLRHPCRTRHGGAWSFRLSPVLIGALRLRQLLLIIDLGTLLLAHAILTRRHVYAEKFLHGRGGG